MMMLAAISPAGVLVSMSKSAKWSTHPSRAACSIKPAPSRTERLNRSNLATSRPSARPCRTSLIAANAPGLPFSDFALMSLDVNLRHTRPSSPGTRAQREPPCASDFQLSSSELLSKSRFGKRQPKRRGARGRHHPRQKAGIQRRRRVSVN
jgi:hypothetical protein